MRPHRGSLHNDAPSPATPRSGRPHRLSSHSGGSGPEGRSAGATAGYSGTPLHRKLGIKAGARVAWVRAPEHFDELLGELPDGVRLKKRASAPVDLVVSFAKRRAQLERELPRLREAIRPSGAVWAAWPKRSSGVATDITEDVIRDVALPIGLVDIKVCAIDETWSGLKLVIRKELR